MNTENNTGQQMPTTESVGGSVSVSPNLNVPPPPTPPEAAEPGKETKFSTLRVAIIVLAALALAGAAAIFFVNRQNQPAPPSGTSTTSTGPTVTSKPAGLNLAVSDDPEILEQELNDTYLDNLDSELGNIETELTKL